MTNINDGPELIGISKAAERLDVSPKTIRRNFELVKIGARSLVRVSDLQAKISGRASRAA